MTITAAEKQDNIRKAREEWLIRREAKLMKALEQAQNRAENAKAKGKRSAEKRREDAAAEVAILRMVLGV